jgi:hypothetical protein
MSPRQPYPPNRQTTAQVAGNRRRALKALDQMALCQYQLIRWRFVAANLPPTGAKNLRLRAEEEIADLVTKLNGCRSVVWIGLGYDPNAEDAPAPRIHWDKTAMEDD